MHEIICKIYHGTSYKLILEYSCELIHELPRSYQVFLIGLSQTQYFSMLDLAAGYWQVQMDNDSLEKTAFNT